MRRLLRFSLCLVVISSVCVSLLPPPLTRAQTVRPNAAGKCRALDVAARLAFTGALFALTRSSGLTPGLRHCQQANEQEKPKPAPSEPKPAPVIEALPTEGRLAEFPAAEVMRLARMLYIRQRSAWFNAEKLERELLKRAEFGELGLEITRNGKRADLILEVTRKPLTTRFTCAFFEPSSERVVGATTASSLGGEIEPHLAEAIVKQFKAARSKPANIEKKPE